MADQLGIDDLRAHTLITIGTSRALSGDLHGLADLERAIAVAREANSPQSSRGLNNLATVHVHLGQLARAFEHYEEARREAERFGHGVALRWLAGERIVENYWRGLWDEGSREHLLPPGRVGRRRSAQQIDSLLVCAKIHLARADAPSAEAIAGRAVEAARAADDVQNLFPALAVGAHIAVTPVRASRAPCSWTSPRPLGRGWSSPPVVVARRTLQWLESLGRNPEFDLIRKPRRRRHALVRRGHHRAGGAWLEGRGSLRRDRVCS